MDIKVTTHFDKLITELDNTQKLLKISMEKSLQACGEMLKQEMIKRIESGSKTGNMYGNHQASAPGQSPADDSGDLVRSLKVDVLKNGEMNIKGTIYALYLENGTSKMQPRPFIQPSIKGVRRQIQKIFEKEVANIKK